MKIIFYCTEWTRATEYKR